MQKVMVRRVVILAFLFLAVLAAVPALAELDAAGQPPGSGTPLYSESITDDPVQGLLKSGAFISITVESGASPVRRPWGVYVDPTPHGFLTVITVVVPDGQELNVCIWDVDPKTAEVGWIIQDGSPLPTKPSVWQCVGWYSGTVVIATDDSGIAAGWLRAKGVTPPTVTPTSTAVPPTAIPTSTPVAPTITPTSTPTNMPTATATGTPVGQAQPVGTAKVACPVNQDGTGGSIQYTAQADPGTQITYCVTTTPGDMSAQACRIATMPVTGSWGIQWALEIPKDKATPVHGWLVLSTGGKDVLRADSEDTTCGTTDIICVGDACDEPKKIVICAVDGCNELPVRRYLYYVPVAMTMKDD